MRGFQYDLRPSGEGQASYIESVPRIGFISLVPRHLDRLSSLQPIEPYPRAHILNATRYPKPTVEREPSDKLRLLYVGRIDTTKGVDLLLQAVAPLAETHDFHLKIVGTGPIEGALRETYAGKPWVEFTGHAPLQAATDAMATSDMLSDSVHLARNSPGVVIQGAGAAGHG